MCIALIVLCAVAVFAFSVDSSPQPDRHAVQTPEDGAVATTNPPAMIWRYDETAVTYTLEMCQDEAFSGDVVRVEGIDLPFYNHSATLAEGTWHWRYYVVRDDGSVSEPSMSKSFVVTADSVALPVPKFEDILANLPAHPRVYVTPDTLEGFRTRREDVGAEAWDEVRYSADSLLDQHPAEVELSPMPDPLPKGRKNVFYLKDGQAYTPKDIDSGDLNSAGSRANVLSFAYLISGDEKYAKAAREWMMWLTPFRMDYHLSRENRSEHDTVVYNYEYGLKYLALTYDRIYDTLSAEDRQAVLDHVEYHGDNAYRWCHDRLKLHLNYENSHGQQCMHQLVTTTMAVLGDLEAANEWADWLIKQYVNRLAWGGEDGGYIEGQTYGHKYGMILDALASIRTATGVDIFQKPRVRNSGNFWLYCMSMNYWWNHWGDVYHLLNPMVGNGADAYIANLLASMTENRTLKWYARENLASPTNIPFWYTSESGLEPKPPIDVAQARVFPVVGQIAAYDRFYDHHGNRVFFRSSPWGSHSHSHGDQNGFVLHANGEIMACDAGYYTYCGDTYHWQFSVASQAHNTMLVNGAGQPKNVASKGRVDAFFNTPRYCVFRGDAEKAYAGMLERFDRTMLFVRPGVWVVWDDIAAPEPSKFSWLLQAFEAAEFDEENNRMTVRQRDERLEVRHLMPEKVEYTQSNKRPFPMMTKLWCRYTEAFPQQYTIRVTNAEELKSMGMLSVMQAYDVNDGPALGAMEQLGDETCGGVRFATDGMVETVLFQSASVDNIDTAGVESDAQAVVIACAEAAEADVPERWLAQGGSRLAWNGTTLLEANDDCDASVDSTLGTCAAQITLRHDRDLKARVRLSQKPQAVLAAPPSEIEKARPIEFAWGNGMASFTLEESGEMVLWVDPVKAFSTTAEPLTMIVQDSDGEYKVELEQAIADTGEIVAFGELAPREQGIYTVNAPGAEVLLQDHWDPTLSVRGDGEAAGDVREATEIFVRYMPGETPKVVAKLAQSYRGQLVNLLRNGGFEEGVEAYPPRGWTVTHPRKMGLTWPEWHVGDAASGNACLRFFRPEISMTLNSQPMKLRTAGTYTLRFKAKGDATVAKVLVSGKRGSSGSVEINASEDWVEYSTEVDMAPGYAKVAIVFGSGGQPDQTLWVDDMEFGYTAK